MLRLVSICYCLLWGSLAGVAAGQAPREQSCSDFVEWVRHQPPESNPRKLVAGFRDELLRSGTSETEVERRMPQVWRCAFQDREAVRFLWNKVYAGDDPIFRDAPSKLLVDFVEQFPPGAALDVGMGQGRNSIYLALKGWNVTGFDPSDQGVRIARSAAARAGVEIGPS